MLGTAGVVLEEIKIVTLDLLVIIAVVYCKFLISFSIQIAPAYYRHSVTSQEIRYLRQTG